MSMDNDSFLELLIPNQKRLFSYIVKLIPNYSDAEDVMQEVVQLLWKKYSDYVPNTDFIAWALSIARYKVFEYYKESKRNQQRLSNETVRILEKESLISNKEFDRHLEAIKTCLDKLKQSDYLLIKLRYELNEKVKSIAARFGCSVQNIYRNLTRVHNLLLSCVNRQYHREES